MSLMSESQPADSTTPMIITEADNRHYLSALFNVRRFNTTCTYQLQRHRDKRIKYNIECRINYIGLKYDIKQEG